MANITTAKIQVVMIDAAGRTMGRVASEAAMTLRGKRLVTFAPNLVPAIQVVVSNVGQLRFTGTKLTTKKYHRFSGYPGGIKTTTLQQEFERDPIRLVRQAVSHMLPKNRLNSRLIKNLKIFVGAAR